MSIMELQRNEELCDLLIAISVVAKRLARNIREIEEKGEYTYEDNGAGYRGAVPCSFAD